MTTLVLVETEDGALSTLSLEALTLARGLGAPLAAVAVGDVPAAALEGLTAYGVSALHVAQDARLDGYAAAAWAACVVDAVAASAASVVLSAASPRGNEVMAHVAVRLGARMAANVTQAEASDGGAAGAALVVRRQVMGGSALEESVLDGAVRVFTVAGHALEPVPADPATVDGPVAVQPFSPTLTEADLVARVRRTVPASSGGGDLTKARIVVGAGRGVGGADKFDGVLELTQRLGGALGVSRVVTSLGWRPHHEQVGQTGTRVSPDVYLACGISGAIQHWAGMSSAKTIVAINTDPEAPMVTKAHYAVIGDLHTILPAVNAELASRGH